MVDYVARTVRWLLGATAHPGGEALTARVLDELALPAGSLVVDVACGRGAALRLLAARGLRGAGVDLEPRAVAATGGRAVVGDAQALPVASSSADAVLCECSVSTFADPARACRELARVVRPGGAVVVTDVVLHRDRADPAVVAAVDRLTTARTPEQYRRLLEDAGLRVRLVEDRRADALALSRRVARRLRLVGARRAAATARACTRAVEAGDLSYVVLVAERPVR